MRLAVDWTDAQNGGFSSGVIDTTAAPYNGNSVEGQSVLCVNPASAADSGIWVLGSHATPEEVPVTRRADSNLGDVFQLGELIVSINDFPTIYQLEIYDGALGQDVASAALDGVNIGVYPRQLITAVNEIIRALVNVTLTLPQVRAQAVTVGVETISSGATTVNERETTLIDATDSNVTVKLFPADMFGNDSPNSFLKTIKRIDSSGNAVTIALHTDTDYLEGVENGTITLGPLESAQFRSDGVSKWWRI